MSKNDSSDRSLSWLGRLRRHPIFPLLLLIPITQIVRDHYPISHYPMYSRPNYEESVFFFVGDTDQKPVPVKLESGISVSQVGKKYRFHKLELIQKEEKKGRLFGQLTPEDISEIESTAGIKTLKFIREQSLKRRRESDLTDELRLVEVRLFFNGEKFEEKNQILATLAPSS
jgi:hypothetical protein